MSRKIMEFMIIITLAGIIFILITPVIKNMGNHMKMNSIKNDVGTIVNSVNNAFMSANMTGEADLPFVVEFTAEGSKIISNGNVISNVGLKYMGELPIGGSVIINKDQSVNVKALTFKSGFVCSKAPGTEVSCEGIMIEG